MNNSPKFCFPTLFSLFISSITFFRRQLLLAHIIELSRYLQLLSQIDGYLPRKWFCLPPFCGTNYRMHISFISLCSCSWPIQNTMTYIIWCLISMCKLHRSLCPEQAISRTRTSLLKILQRQFKQPCHLTFICI